MKENEVIPEKKVVFISYRRAASSTLASAVAQGLIDKYNFDVFFDKYDTEPGEIEEKLKKNIDNCTHFILFVNDKTFDYKTNQKSKRNQKTKTNQNRDDKYLLIEITHALEKYNKSRESIKIIPIYVNMKKLNNDDKRLINNKIEQIADFDWIQYDEEKETPEDLIQDVLKKLGYDDSAEKERKRREKNIKKLKQSIFAILATVVAAAGLVFGGTRLQQWMSSKTPKLVFAGGGSVANMIKEITGDSVDIEHYKNAIYLNLPSEDAWALMPQEIMTSHMSDDIENKFYPVCLSALEAKDSVFLETVTADEITKKGTIISYYLGEDILKVYVDSVKGIELGLPKDSLIKKDILYSKIKEWCKDKSFKIYITRERSGTYFIYKNEFPVIFNNSDYNWHLTPYNEKLAITNLKNNGNNYIVLSSHYYTPDSISKLKPIMIVDNGSIKSKSMYLYFACKRYNSKDEGANCYMIPDEMVRFFKKIDSNITITPLMSNNDESLVVTPLESLKIYKPKPNTKPTKSK